MEWDEGRLGAGGQLEEGVLAAREMEAITLTVPALTIPYSLSISWRLPVWVPFPLVIHLHASALVLVILLRCKPILLNFVLLTVLLIVINFLIYEVTSSP